MNSVPDVLHRSARLKLFLMLRYLGKAEAMGVNLAAHLEWTIELERQARLVMSGPIIPPGEGGLIGLTVLRVRSEDEAREIADGDPFVRAGYVHYQLCPWTVFEGAIPLTVRLSDSSVEFS